MENKTKEELIEELSLLINKLIDNGKLKYYPFSRNHKNFSKKLLINAIEVFQEK
jgi:hypothetical protein